jgi:short subunit dehydrogenase-like uncharacterized protein
MAASNWLLYGANGYTGQLIADEAHRRGMRPILAGRSEEKVRPIGERLGLDWRAFALDSADEVAAKLDGLAAILLAAGPFSTTSRPVVDACLRTGTHYLDITGEIEVFERVHARDGEARDRGCVLLPGVGFDVVPSDCLAASLREALPNATHLELAFHAGGGPSAGTAKTALENMHRGGAIRRDGRIEHVPAAWATRVVGFRDRPRHAVSIPWGDVSTAYYSTRIPNIVVYMAMPRNSARLMKLARPFLPLAGAPPVQRALKALVERRVKGPDAEERRTARAQLWGRVSSPDGGSAEGTLVTPEGYGLTARTAVESLRRVLEGKTAPGALTPSMAFGKGFITEFEGCDLRVNPCTPDLAR